jgi:ribosomal protein S19
MNKNEKLYSRNITLTSFYLNKNINCHKGLQVGKLFINESHLVNKFGEFFVTKFFG